MRAASVIAHGQRRAGIVDGEGVYVTDVAGLEAAIAAGIDLSTAEGTWEPLAAVRFDAPLRPPAVLCAGQNYRDHLDEKAPVEVKVPEFFIKAGQTIAAPGQPCILDPAVTRKLDYETELGVVIGRPGRRIPAAEAFDHVAGYVVLNDLTARDRQVVRNEDGTWGLALGPGKNFDGSTRMSACMITADEIEDPHDLRLTTEVNGGLRQSNSTASMVFTIPEIIEYLSTLLTLQSGTVIATGTPGGTGWGMDPELGGTSVVPAGCEPASYLAVGDRLVSRIQRIGELILEVTDRDDAQTRLAA